MDRLISIVLPRIKDFCGLSTESFDVRRCYTFGVREQAAIVAILFVICLSRNHVVAQEVVKFTEEQAMEATEYIIGLYRGKLISTAKDSLYHFQEIDDKNVLKDIFEACSGDAIHVARICGW